MGKKGIAHALEFAMSHDEGRPAAPSPPHLVAVDGDGLHQRRLGEEPGAALSTLLLAVYAFAERRTLAEDLCTSLRNHLGCGHVALLRLTRSGAADKVLAVSASRGPVEGTDAGFPSRLLGLRLPEATPGQPGDPGDVLEVAGTDAAASSLLLGIVAAHDDYQHLVCLESSGPDVRRTLLAGQLRNLLPHLKQALRLREAMDEFRARVLVDANVLHRAPSGFLVLTAAGTIEYANEEAEHILAENEGLCRAGAELVIDDLKLRETLSLSVNELRGLDDHTQLQARSLQVSKTSGRPAYIVTLLPVVVTGDDSFLAPRRRLLMVVTNAAPRRLPGVDYLQRTFGMTRAEARVCRALCNGDETDTAAAALSISVATAKTHLMRIYQKLEVNSRARLVQRLQGHYWVEKPIVVTVDSATPGIAGLVPGG
jgi:DNA-binding CsgD family transcriptional regulator